VANEDVLQWLSAARDGSENAMGQMLESCRGYLLLIARQELDPALVPKGSASDLVQETLLDALRGFRQFQGHTEAELLGWLRKLLLNNLASFARRYRGTEKRQLAREAHLASPGSSVPNPGEPRGSIPSPSDQAMQREEAEALETAIARLPEDYQQVLTLRYLEDRSFEEIGEQMQRSANAVRKLWTRAVERLQRELETPP